MPPPPYFYYPPVFFRPPPPPGDGKTHFTVRASGGVGFLGGGYYCGYYYAYYVPIGYGCGGGFATAQPDVNLDLDVWVEPSIALSLGANVMWGTFTPAVGGVPPNNIYSKTWEPHVDVLLSPSYYGSSTLKGRVRLGFGLYVADVHGLTATGQNVQYNAVGGAFRMGVGFSILPKSIVGFGVDAIFEAGWLGSYYVSTLQLLIGPELNF